jgi:3D (Asp-Asp-Asp) domain-containing protein
MPNKPSDYLKFAILLLAFILLFAAMAAYDTAVMREESLKPDPAIVELCEQFERLESDIDSLRESLNEINEWLDKLQVGEFKITGYAPHDPAAVAGMCHNGDPDSTATGTYPTPGRTIATDPSVIPMGSRVLIDGHVYIAEDTGGAIKGNRIDIVTASRAEAYAITRDKVMVIWQ